MTPPHPWQVTVLGDRRCGRGWLCQPSCDARALAWVADEGDLLLDRWACGGSGDYAGVPPQPALGLGPRGAA